jgi:nucleoside-diphosphate-sugar epimerase
MRISAPYSPMQKARTVLKVFIENALLNNDLTYFGSGMRSQDFTHSSDIANAINNAIRRWMFNECSTEIFNISSGNSISMKGLVHLVILVC